MLFKNYIWDNTWSYPTLVHSNVRHHTSDMGTKAPYGHMKDSQHQTVTHSIISKDAYISYAHTPTPQCISFRTCPVAAHITLQPPYHFCAQYNGLQDLSLPHYCVFFFLRLSLGSSPPSLLAIKQLRDPKKHERVQHHPHDTYYDLCLLIFSLSLRIQTLLYLMVFLTL